MFRSAVDSFSVCVVTGNRRQDLSISMLNPREFFRPLWHRINPAWLRARRRAERQWIRTRTYPARWLRHTWPVPSDLNNERVAVVTVNYNTAEHISHLLFSLFRVVGREQLERIVVVDNASTDDSPALLSAMAEAGLIDLVRNKSQRFHGPGLNQAVARLVALQRCGACAARYVWVIDSDVIVLRADAVRNAVGKARADDAAILGQIAYDEIASGYAHISSMLIDAPRVWRRSQMPFEESGTPAYELHRTVRQQRMPIADFPYRTKNYVLHVTSRTLAKVAANGETQSKYYGWAAGGWRLPFHGNPDGERIFSAFETIFRQEVGDLTPQNLVTACTREGLITVPGVEPRSGPDAAAFVVTGVVGPPIGGRI